MYEEGQKFDDIIFDNRVNVGFFSRLFWFFFDWTIGLILGFIRERKSKEAIESLLSDEEKVEWQVQEGQAVILAQARRNFGNNKFAEIFKTEIKFFNKNSKFMKKICENVANAIALDAVYNVNIDCGLNGKPLVPAIGLPDALGIFYLNCPRG